MRLDTNKLIHYILILLFVAVHGAVDYAQYQANYIPQIVVFALAIILGYKMQMPRDIMSYAVVLTVLLIPTLILVRGGIGPKLILDMTLAYTITKATFDYDREHFMDRFVNVLNILSVISIVGWGLWTYMPSVGSALLPARFAGPYGLQYGNLLFTMKYNDVRNSGMFYESGVYATVLVLTIFYLLFVETDVDERKLKRSVALYIITLVTTYSTMGYICLAVMLVLFIFKNRNELKIGNLKNYVIIAVILMSAFFLMDNHLNGEESIINVQVIQKLEEQENDYLAYATSGQARINTMNISLELIKNNPFGAGYSAFDRVVLSRFGNNVTGGNILFKHLATAGILVYIFTLWSIFRNTFRYTDSVLNSIVFIVLIILICWSQSQMWYPVFMLYGHMLLYNREKLE